MQGVHAHGDVRQQRHDMHLGEVGRSRRAAIDDCRAEAVFGHRQSRVIRLHRDHRRQPHAVLAAGLVDADAERVLAVERDQRHVRQIGQLHATRLHARRRQQALGQDALHVDLGQRFVFQRGLSHRADDEAHIGLLQQERGDDLRRVQRLHMNLHLWIFFAEPGHRARQHVAAECKHGQHGEPIRCLTMAQIGGEALHFIELLEQLFDVREQRERFVGRRESSARTLEQRKAQLQLRMLQRAADGWLRDVDEPRSRAHAAGLHDGVEDFDVPQSHGRARSGCGSVIQMARITARLSLRARDVRFSSTHRRRRSRG